MSIIWLCKSHTTNFTPRKERPDGMANRQVVCFALLLINAFAGNLQRPNKYFMLFTALFIIIWPSDKKIEHMIALKESPG